MIFLFVLSDDESKDRISEYYLKNVDRLISIARQILNNIYDAEDAVQNAFIAIAESPKTAEIEDEKFDNWCVVIVKHKSYDIFKKNAPLRNAFELDDSKNLEISDDFWNKLLKNSDLKQTLVTVIGKLNEEYKELFELKYVMGFSLDEIAKLKALTKNQISGILKRAKAKLKDLLIKEGYTNE